MASRRKWKPMTLQSIWRMVRMFAVLLLCYLVQVCVMPYLRIGGVTPSLVVIAIAVVTVAFGKLRAFWAGAFFGIVLEAMQPTRSLMNLMLYPIAALFCSVIFSDKSSQQIDYERSMGKVGRNVTPMLRTPLCALVLITIYETVNIVYIYLRGTDLNLGHISRGLLDIVLTGGLCCIMMVPLRRLMGVRYDPEAEFEPAPYTGASRPIR